MCVCILCIRMRVCVCVSVSVCVQLATAFLIRASGTGGSITQKDKCPFRRKGQPNKYNSIILLYIYIPIIYLWRACRTLYILYLRPIHHDTAPTPLGILIASYVYTCMSATNTIVLRVYILL